MTSNDVYEVYNIIRSTFVDLQDLELRMLTTGKNDVQNVQIGKFVSRLAEALKLLNPEKEIPSPYAHEVGSDEEEELILE